MEDGWMDEWIYGDLDTAVYINTGYFGSYKMRENVLPTDLCPSPSNVRGPENQL